MRPQKIQSIKAKCKNELDHFFEQAMTSLCTSKEAVAEAFGNFELKMVDGIVFRTNRELNRSALRLAAKIAECFGASKTSVKEITDRCYKVLSELLHEFDASNDSLRGKFEDEVFSSLALYWDFVGPCEIINFEGVDPDLRSEFVSIVKSDRFLKDAEIPLHGKDWTMVSSDEAWPDRPDFRTHAIYGTVWWIRTQSHKDLAPEAARWMAEVFLSSIRLGLRPADYCHRAGIGQVEPEPFSTWFRPQRFLAFRPDVFSGSGFQRHPTYKIDETFHARFSDESLQKKLSSVLNPRGGYFEERISQGLGWLARGRQSSDMSLRLLFFFTALEAIFSDQNSFVPVSDTIARYAGVVLASEVGNREGIYLEMRKLYQLRSDLIHRGARNVHLLNANNIQHIAENVFAILFEEADFSLKHESFLHQLKSASHGTEWPPLDDDAHPTGRPSPASPSPPPGPSSP